MTIHTQRVMTRFFATAFFTFAAFLFISTAQAQAATETVSENTSGGENQPGWMFNRDTDTQTPFEFNFDQKKIGSGSLFVPAITNSVNGDSDKFIAEDFLLTPIADITSISYDFLTLDEADASQFYMSVYANFGTSSPTKFYDCRYSVVPTVGSSVDFTTVTFDLSQAYPVTQSGSSPETCPSIPAEMNTASSTGATIRVIALNVGDTSGSDTGVSGYLDNIVVNTTSDAIVTDFEPEPLPACDTNSTFDSFTTGSVNGQGGWSATGPYDQEVVDNTYGFDSFGCQSLRISNAVTSGAFGDQTFAPELVNGAGEIGNTRFEAQFDISSTMPDEQPGLALSVSPDDGLGSRMSYLSFTDEAGGIRVAFYDVQGTTTPANFVSEDLGLISRTPHTIKFVMDFVAGENNDIVKIYIDGQLVHTGTSWENYYRHDPEQSGNGNVVPPVDTLLFRASGAAVSANSGEGFLFDNVNLSSSVTPVTPTPSTSGGGGGGGKHISLTDQTEDEVVVEEDTEAPGEVLGASTSTIPVVYYSFLVDFGIGTENTDVTNLQTILIAKGYLSINAPTGYFGPLTQAAVREYQAAHGISATGFVGPLTRAQLNTEPVIADPIALKIADLLAQVAALQEALNALNAQ